VGAGVAGLAAATRLAEAGTRALVLEASPRPGGRARSYHEPRLGREIDNGQHLLMGCYRETIAFLARIGSLEQVRFQERLRVDFRDASGDAFALDCPPLPGRASLLAGLALCSGLGLGDRFGLLKLAKEVPEERADPDLGDGNTTGSGDRPGRSSGRPDGRHGARPEPTRGRREGAGDETAAVWLARLGQSARARRNFWDPLVLATLNESPDVASARALRTVLRLGLLGGPEAARLGWPRSTLGALFARPAQRYLESRGSAVRCSARVVAAEPSADGVDLRLRAGEIVRARAAVIAVPPRALRLLLPESLAASPGLSGIGELREAPIVNVHLHLDREVSGLPMAALLGTTMQWAFERAPDGPARGGAQQAMITLVLSGARREVGLDAGRLVAAALADLRAVFPRAERARLLGAAAVKERDATISPAAGWDALRPGSRTESPRLFLAGDWTATGLPATIESAVLSGHRAASAAMEVLG